KPTVPLVAAIVFFLFLGSARAAAPRAATTNPVAGGTVFPTFGVALSPPAGWEERPATKVSQVAQWYKPATESGKEAKPAAAIEITVEPAGGLTLVQAATNRAKAM